ncbi:IPTL-CTERM sorting domain-containing protein [Brevundimonas sp.]|uniref:IPTL-CTERM sorting domain-containing protein n=1 Tax=Brevundimonas sp. TaxID=1871086 RepID=UPI0026388D90|nr:IPTL-CTERM sorting domain-containing protein [Brevundimonas sp.]
MFELSRRLAGLGAAIALAFIAGSAQAGTLTNVSVTLSNTATSSPTTLTLNYTIATAMDGTTNNTLLIAGFPGLVMVDGTENACPTSIIVSANGTDISSNLSRCRIFGGNSVLLRLAPGASVPANAAIVVTIANTRVTTSSTPGTYTANPFCTRDTGADCIDEPSTLPSYTVIAPTPVPTLSEWAMIVFGTILAGGTALYLQRRRQLG